jgi:enoyl-CoA hydratase/carnithine racemase
MSDVVAYEQADGIATVRIDDGKVNALGLGVLDALHGAFDRAEDEGAAVLLTGRDGYFSAGFDLKVFATGGRDLVRMLELGATLMHRILAFRRPVVIAASGHAMAAGAFLLLAADVRVGAAGGYRIGLNETQIGLTLPWPVIEVARFRIDPSRRDEAVVAATVYDPDGAVAVGYLDRVVDAGALADEATRTAAALAALDARAYADNKQRLRGPAIDAVQAGIERMMVELEAALAG